MSKANVRHAEAQVENTHSGKMAHISICMCDNYSAVNLARSGSGKVVSWVPGGVPLSVMRPCLYGAVSLSQTKQIHD